jgi:hypothetical protein
MIKSINFSRLCNASANYIKKNKLLFAIILVGFVLRILPILWGIPINEYVRMYHPDEGHVLRSIGGFPKIYFSTKTFMGYGTFVPYTLGFLFMPFKLIRFIGFQDLHKILIFLLSRFSNVLMGTATIYFTYLLAKTIFNKKIAVLSAALLACSFYHVMNSAIITLDVAMGLMIVINFLLCFHAVEKNSFKLYVLLGIASGMLIGTKITGGLFVAVPIALALLRIRQYNSNDLYTTNAASNFLRNIIIYISTVIIVFLLYHPHVYLDPEKYINFFLREKRDWVDRTSVSFWGMFLIWVKSTITSVGLPVTILSIIGFIFPKKYNSKFQYALIFFLVLYYGFWRWFMLPRYLISVAPIICIFAANACIYFFEFKNAVIKLVAIGAIVTSIATSFYLCVSGINLRFRDTRPAAAKYIMQNIEKGRSIGIGYVSEKYPWKTFSWRHPKINFAKYKEMDFLNNPDIIILSSDDFHQIIETLNSDKINGEYALGKKYYKEWYRYSPPSVKILRFYDNFFNQDRSNYSLMIAFKKDINVPVEFPPPEIRIYKKNN